MYDIVIIGAGPAGASAAIFTARAEKKTLIVDNDKTKVKRAWLKNYYGIPEISGQDLLELGKNQAINNGAEMIVDTVNNVLSVENYYIIETDTKKIETKHILFATGTAMDLAEKVGLKIIPGIEPRVKQIIETDQIGHTNKKGIWAAGNASGNGMHTIVAAGNGAQVAINLISELNEKTYIDHEVKK